MFAYCNNSPIMRIDISGLYSSELVLEWATGAAGLAAIDGPLPFGDMIYIGGLLILGGFAIVYVANESSLPNQGPVSEVPDAPPVNAGQQGKHVPGHPNYTPSKSQWEKGENGVRETQEAWKNGKTVRPDGSVRVGRASDGRRIKVHRGKHGYIHGYPVAEVK